MSFKSPSVTIAVCTFARPRLLEETLRGLIRQEYDAAEAEILVVNNAPDHAAVAEVVAQLPKRALPVRLVHEPTCGLSHARNRALRESVKDVIVFADDDVLADAEWLRQLVTPFAADTCKSIAAVGGEVISLYPEGVSKWEVMTYRPLGLRETAGPLNPRQLPMGANMAFRRAALEEVGGFDTRVGRCGNRLFAGDENRPIQRLRERGYEIWFCPEARVLHQMPRQRTTLAHGWQHAFDTARSRVIGRVSQLREVGRPATGYLCTRLVLNLVNLLPLTAQTVLAGLIMQPPALARSLSRVGRSLGYVRQCSGSLSASAFRWGARSLSRGSPAPSRTAQPAESF